MAECNGHGEQVSGTCFCDAGWFNSNCDQDLKSKWSQAYHTYIGCFIAFFSIMALISLKTLRDQLNERKQLHQKSGCNFYCGMMQSPQNVCLAFSFIFCMIKIAWLAIDPFQMNGILERVYERLLAEIVYSFLFAIYAILLMVWYTLYDEVSYNTGDSTQKRTYIWSFFKCFLKLRILLVFVLQAAISIIKGLRMNEQYRYYSYTVYGVLYLNFILFVFEFTVYGYQLYRCIDDQIKQNTQQYNNQKQAAQIDYLGVIYKDKAAIQPSASQIEQSKRDPQQTASRPLVQFQDHTSPIGGQRTDPIKSFGNPSQDEQFESQFVKSESDDTKNVLKKSKGSSYSKTFAKRGIKKGDTLVRQDSFSKKSSGGGGEKIVIPTELGPESQNQVGARKSLQLVTINSSSFNLDENVEEVEWNVEVRKGVSEEIQARQMKVVKEVKREVMMKQSKKRSTTEQKKREFRRLDNVSLDDHEKKVMEEEIKQYVQAQFYNKREHLNLDKKVLQKIFLLMVAGVLLEVCFGILSVIVYATTLLQQPIGVLVILYVDGMLEVLSLGVVFKLFEDIKSKEIENLIWIKKIGNKNNQINRRYRFTLPEHLKDGDLNRQKFENRINQC